MLMFHKSTAISAFTPSHHSLQMAKVWSGASHPGIRLRGGGRKSMYAHRARANTGLSGKGSAASAPMPSINQVLAIKLVNFAIRPERLRGY